MNIIITHWIYADVKKAIELFLVEKPPVAMVLQEWQNASKSDIPPNMRSAVSQSVSNTYALQRLMAVW